MLYSEKGRGKRGGNWFRVGTWRRAGNFCPVPQSKRGGSDMGRFRKGAALCVAAAAGAFVLAGCATLTGGGWLPGVNGGRATFGFNLTCSRQLRL